MTDETPNIYPFLRYADGDAALEWLGRAFGFETLMVHRGGDDGPVQHAEISLGPGIVMLGEGDRSDRGIYVAVDDADAHYERAKAAGAQIVRELEDTPYGSREYTARDPEGNVWSFGTYRPTVS
ncbi:MAG: VOC family protein [Actinomycetota bacterium]|nr:VOC family protein [Actinomycetota bacterium]